MGLVIMFDDRCGRKQALLGYKNLYFERSPYWDFFKGVNPWLWSKIENFLFCLFLGKMGIKITFGDHLVKERAHLDKNIDFT